MTGSSVSGVLYLIRHASAGDRRGWHGDDSTRPLDAIGQAQAGAIAAWLASASIRRVCSSPSIRCIQTVKPLAAQFGLDVVLSAELAEGAEGNRAEAVLEGVCTEPGDSVLCSHGDVIPKVLLRMARRGIDVDPTRCKKASIWELHVADGTIVHGVYRSPRNLGLRREDLA